ncbi:MAG: PRTRC system protein E [Proteobacteria bacterium]|nr:PRTRC system protein E [Pseudomonadota bacterium]
MFFQIMQPLLKGCLSLTLVLTAEGELISVTVLPKPQQSGEDAAALSTPLSLTGTAAELDEQFAGIIGKYDAARTDLAEQLETTTAVIEAAKAASSTKATTALKKAGSKADTTASVIAPSGSSEEGGGEDEEDESGTAGAAPAAAVIPAAPSAEIPNLFG